MIPSAAPSTSNYARDTIPVNDVTLSGDGKLAVSASADHTLIRHGCHFHRKRQPTVIFFDF